MADIFGRLLDDAGEGVARAWCLVAIDESSARSFFRSVGTVGVLALTLGPSAAIAEPPSLTLPLDSALPASSLGVSNLAAAIAPTTVAFLRTPASAPDPGPAAGPSGNGTGERVSRNGWSPRRTEASFAFGPMVVGVDFAAGAGLGIGAAGARSLGVGAAVGLGAAAGLSGADRPGLGGAAVAVDA